MIINGDCFDELKKMADKSVDLILTDPPYFISKPSNFKIINDNTPEECAKKFNYTVDFGDWDKGELDWDILFNEYYRVLKKGGSLIIFYDIWKSSEMKKYAELNKFKQPRIGYWVKTNPVPINSKSNYLSNAIETFFTFVKAGKPTFKSRYDNGIYSYPICHGKERLKHPTQKPLSLMKDLVEKHSNEGDLILDSFAGTGTTGKACEELNRKYIMVEENEGYYNMMKKRLK